QIWTDSKQMQDFDAPRALETSEIPAVIAQYAAATRKALDAGFDGVELHSASGYLPMQFLSSNTNQRTEAYGGSAQNSIRFVDDAGNRALASGLADFIVFGKLFTSNPDLPARFEKDGALVDPDPSTFYSPGPKGYTDYGYRS